MQGYGKIQAIGGDGTSYVDNSVTYTGGGGSGGRIAMYFNQNKTYTGTFDAYGGLGGNNVGNGSPGTAFFYHTGIFALHNDFCFLLYLCFI